MNLEDGSPAPQPEAQNYANPNDLDFEMTPEQEQEYVNQILGNGNYVAPVETPPEVNTPVVADEPATPVAPMAPIEPVAPVADTPVTPVTPQENTPPQTDDLWIEVEQIVEDDLGEKTTKTVKLTYDPNDPSSFIPEDFTASTKQLADIMDAKAEMAKIYGERQGEFDKVEQDKSNQSQQQALLDSWDAEIQDLIDSGLIEAPKLKPNDPKYTEDPSVLRTDAVFKFMTEENTKRIEAGKQPIRSFGTAFSLYENSEAVKAAAEAKKKDEEDTKARGAMIGGSSAASGGKAEKPVYKAGSHNNIWSVPVLDD